MKKICILPAIMVFIFAHTVSCTADPRIEFKELEYNFGQVAQETELKHLFTFINTGNSVLEITDIKPG